MKIALSSFGPNLMSQLSPRVKGCHYLLILDPANLANPHLEVFENKGSDQEDDDGNPALEYMLSRKVNALITGRCRKDTFEILTKAGIGVYLKQSGIVKDVLEKYTHGLLKRATRPDAREGS